jgi:hypothetical protein
MLPRTEAAFWVKAVLQILPKPKEFTHHLSIILTFTFFRRDLRTSVTLDVGGDHTLKPSDQREHEPQDQCEHESSGSM